MSRSIFKNIHEVNRQFESVYSFLDNNAFQLSSEAFNRTWDDCESILESLSALRAIEETAASRNLPFLRYGMHVEVLDGGVTKKGIIVGANQSANIKIQLEDGHEGYHHPDENVKYFDFRGYEISARSGK